MEQYDYICYFDGACEPKNPGGNMGIGAIITDREGTVLDKLSHFVKPSENNSNNVAEYQGFGWVLKRISQLLPVGSKVVVRGDSKLVICQMKGEWGMKKGMYIQYAVRAKQLLEEIKKNIFITLEWVPREENGLADELSKGCMIANNVHFKIQPL